MIVRAVDRGTPALSSTVDVHVIIDDEDDNPPQFKSNELYYNVKEDTHVGETVVTLKAHDPDEGYNAKITYLQADDLINLSTWELDFDSGELRTLKELDYEERSNYTIIVTASSSELISQVRCQYFLYIIQNFIKNIDIKFRLFLGHGSHPID